MSNRPIMFSRFTTQIIGLVGPKYYYKLPSNINVSRHLHDQGIFGKTKAADAGRYAFLAPIKQGQRHSGVDKGPKYLKDFIPREVEIVDPLADLKLPTQQQGSIADPAAVSLLTKKLHESIVEKSTNYLKQYKSMPSILTLGGDHSLALGSVSAVASVCAQAVTMNDLSSLPFKNPELVVIWVDAHHDIHIPTSDARLFHAVIASGLLGIGRKAWTELKDFGWVFDDKYLPQGKKSFVQHGHLAYIGLSKSYADFVRNEDKERYVRLYEMKDIINANRNITKIIQECIQEVDPKGTHPIYLSFDIDAIPYGEIAHT